MSREDTRQRGDHQKVFQDNLRLRRENVRLRKVIRRLQHAVSAMSENGFTGEEETEKPSRRQVVPTEIPTERRVPHRKETPEARHSSHATRAGDSCPRCSAETEKVELGDFLYLFCSACNFRTRLS